MNVACIGCGVGGKGDSDSDHAARFANVVAICDVDEKHLHAKETDEKKSEELRSTYAKAKKYSDFRKMFDEMGKDIDAVVTSTPDHTHAVATMMAIKAGKHVYTQKPLTHDVWEARQLRLAAKEHKVATQMGNQGTADPVLREGVELIQAGVLGAVKEVHVWTNRPDLAAVAGRRARPAGGQGAGGPRLGPLARHRARAAVRRGVPPVQLARLVGFRHRRAGRHGLPHRQPAVHGAEARPPRPPSRRSPRP